MTSPASPLAALALSAAVHAAVAAAFGGHLLGTTRGTTHEASLLVEVPAPTLETLVAPNAAPAEEKRPAAATHASHTHPYPVPADHDATPHDPSIVHLLPAPAPHSTPAVEPVAAAAALVSSAPDPAPRFVMVIGAAASAPGGVTARDGAAVPSGGGAETVTEEGVDARPVLLTGDAPPYPAAAAAAGIEVNVPVAIVIGVDGAVEDARAQGQFGYGLEEAATKAVRSYRFSRGLRGGKPVRVRMTWTVMFRLK
jgi:TonB family protein